MIPTSRRPVVNRSPDLLSQIQLAEPNAPKAAPVAEDVPENAVPLDASSDIEIPENAVPLTAEGLPDTEETPPGVQPLPDDVQTVPIEQALEGASQRQWQQAIRAAYKRGDSLDRIERLKEGAIQRAHIGGFAQKNAEGTPEQSGWETIGQMLTGTVKHFYALSKTPRVLFGDPNAVKQAAEATAGMLLETTAGGDAARRFVNETYNLVSRRLMDKETVEDLAAKNPFVRYTAVPRALLTTTGEEIFRGDPTPSPMTSTDRERYKKQLEDDLLALDLLEDIETGELLGAKGIVDPQAVQEISDSIFASPVETMTSFVPGGKAATTALRGTRTAARVLKSAQQAGKTIPVTEATKTIAKPIRAAAKAVELVNKGFDSSAILRGAAGGSFAALITDGNPIAAAGGAFLGARYPQFRSLRTASGTASKTLSDLATKLEGGMAAGPMTQFAWKAAAFAGNEAKGFIGGQLANFPYLFGNLTEEEFKNNLAAGSAAFVAGNVAGVGVSGLNIVNNLFGAKQTMPEVRLEVKDYGVSPELDLAHRNVSTSLDNSSSNFVQVLRETIRKIRGFEAYTLFEEDYNKTLDALAASGAISAQTAAGAKGQYGVTLDIAGEDGTPRKVALVKVSKAVPGMSAGHEVGHLFYLSLSPEEQKALNDQIVAVMGEGGIEDYRTTYEGMVQAGMPSGSPVYQLGGDGATPDVRRQLTIEEIAAEQFAAVLNSVPIGKNGVKPSLARTVYSLILRGLEATGSRRIDSVSSDQVKDGALRTPLGLKPSAKVARVIENVVQARLLDSDILRNSEAAIKIEPPVLGKPGQGQQAGEAEKKPAEPAAPAPAPEAKPAAEDWQLDASGKTPMPAYEAADIKEIAPSGPVADEGGLPRNQIVDAVTGRVVGTSARVLQALGDGLWRVEFTAMLADGVTPGPRVTATIRTKQAVATPAAPTPVPAPAPASAPVATPAATPAPAPDAYPLDAQGNATPDAQENTKKQVDDIVSKPRGEIGAHEVDYNAAGPRNDSDNARRQRQRDAADAAEAAARAEGRPNPLRRRFTKVFVPFQRLGNQILAWSPDKIAGNLDLLRGWFEQNPAAKQAERATYDYLTSPQIEADLLAGLQNLSNGYAIEGRRLQRPADTRPGTITPENPNYTPVQIPRERAEVINLLQGLEQQETTTPALAYSLRFAQQNGLVPITTGETADANALRARLRNNYGFDAGKMGLLESAVERLNIERILAPLRPRTDLPWRAGDTGIVQAAFMPAAPKVSLGKEKVEGGVSFGRPVKVGGKLVGSVQANLAEGGFDAETLAGETVGTADTPKAAAQLLANAKAEKPAKALAVETTKNVSSPTGMTPTGWVLPNGEYAGMSAENNPNFANTGDFHSNWLQNNGKRWGLESGDRLAALNKGFVRTRLDGRTGRMGIEANRRFVKGPVLQRILDVVEANSDRIGNLDINLFNDRGEVVATESLPYFRLPEETRYDEVRDALTGARGPLYMPNTGDPNKEKVAGPAIKLPDGRIISGDPYSLTGHTGMMVDLFREGVLDPDDPDPKERYGFVSTTGRFLERSEAFALARAAGQVTKRRTPARGLHTNQNIAYMPATPQGFYSQLEETLSRVPPKASRSQIEAALRDGVKEKGQLVARPVKAEEMRDVRDSAGTSFEQFLKDNPNATRQEMLDFVSENKVQVEETRLGELVEKTYTVTERGNAFVVQDETGYPTVTFPDREGAESWVRRHSGEFRKDQTRSTKFEQYVLPGGENYGETVLTLPEQGPTFAQWLDETKGLTEEDVTRLPADVQESIRISYRQALRDGYVSSSGVKQAKGYASSHFPDVPNYLAHARHNERTTPDGKKVFFVEEIQSDLHQEGRKKGYKEGAFSKSVYRVPDAPFKKSWHELVFKRMLRKAAEAGSDFIAWTTGEQQADRYDLSKRIDSVYYNDATGTLFATRGNETVLSEKIPLDKVDDYVGKEVANKLIEQTPTPRTVGGHEYSNRYTRSVEGADLKVGGEGMKGFYDSILPQFADKYLKRFGVRTETVEVSVGRADIGERRHASDLYETEDGWQWVDDSGEKVGPEFDSEASAEKWRNGVSDTASVHAVRLTPELKAEVLDKGQPMYMPVASPQQESAFKDSKVRGADGKLLPLVHATDKSFDKFGVGDLGYHFGTAEQARDRLATTVRFSDKGIGRPVAATGTRSIPVFLDVRNPLRMLDVGAWSDPQAVWNTLPNDVKRKATARGVDRNVQAYSEKVDSFSESPEAFEDFRREAATPVLQEIRDELKRQGYDGVVYQNQFEDDRADSPGEDSYIAFDNDQIMPAMSKDASARFMPAPTEWFGDLPVPRDWRDLSSGNRLGPKRMVPIDSVRATEKPGENLDVLTEILRGDKEDLPPIVVEEDADGLYVVDGNTRLAAARAAGHKTVPVREVLGEGDGPRFMPAAQPYGYWVSPNGDLIPVKSAGDHARAAKEHLGKSYTEDEAAMALRERGYVHVAIPRGQGELYADSGQGMRWDYLPRKLREALEDIASDRELRVILNGEGDVAGLDFRPERDSRFMPNTYSWLLPTGKFEPVRGGSHGATARLLLNTENDSEGVQSAFGKGWIRVANMGDDLYADTRSSAPLSPKQESVLKDLAIESGKTRVVVDGPSRTYTLWAETDDSARFMPAVPQDEKRLDAGAPARQRAGMFAADSAVRQKFNDRFDAILQKDGDGDTFNPDGTPYDVSGKIVVTLGSLNQKVGSATAQAVKDFFDSHQSLLKSDGAKPGVFRFGDTVSADLNVVLPAESFELAKKFAKDNNQDSIFDARTFDVVKVGGSGQTVLSTPTEYAVAAKQLSDGSYKSIKAVQRLAKAIDKAKADPRNSPAYKELAPYIPENERADLRTDTVRQFVDVVKDLPPGTEYDVATRMGLIKRGWYKRAATAIRQMFGDDTPRFVALVAATSPRQDVAWNFRMALDVWDWWTQNGRPTDIDLLKRELFPKVEMEGRLYNSIRALRGEQLRDLTEQFKELAPGSEAPLSGFKVESFRRNLLGDLSAVTNDIWVAQFSEIAQELFGKKYGYLAAGAKLRQSAERVGLEPAEAQETLWSFFKTLKDLTRVDRPARQVLAELSEADIAQTPEFYDLIHEHPEIQSQLVRLGVLKTGPDGRPDLSPLFDTEYARRRAEASRAPLADVLVERGLANRRVLERIANRAQRLKDAEVAAEAKTRASLAEETVGENPF